MLYLAPESGLVREVVWLGITIAGGSVLFVGASALLRCPELATLLRVLPSRRSR